MYGVGRFAGLRSDPRINSSPAAGSLDLSARLYSTSASGLASNASSEGPPLFLRSTGATGSKVDMRRELLNGLQSFFTLSHRPCLRVILALHPMSHHQTLPIETVWRQPVTPSRQNDDCGLVWVWTSTSIKRPLVSYSLRHGWCWKFGDRSTCVHARRGGVSVAIYHHFLFFVMHRLLDHDSEVRRAVGISPTCPKG